MRQPKSFVFEVISKPEADPLGVLFQHVKNSEGITYRLYGLPLSEKTIGYDIGVKMETSEETSRWRRWFPSIYLESLIPYERIPIQQPKLLVPNE